MMTTLAFAVFVCACGERPAPVTETISDTIPKEKDYIRAIPGTNDTLAPEEVERGKVLIAYSDCHTCHAEDQRSKGPAFRDIAKRYPVNDGYIELLAQRIIAGGGGAWGYPVMSAHPDLRPEEARIMVKYILSLKQ